MPKANSENRDRLVEKLHYFLRYSRVFGRARPRRNHNVGRLQRFDLLKRDTIISENAKLVTHLAQVLDQVVGKGVVVVDNDDHSSKPRWASCMARRSARDLF